MYNLDLSLQRYLLYGGTNILELKKYMLYAMF